MRYCAYRPLDGNGLNRDTSIYVGVQTLENSGVDRRVDLIQTEAGMEWQMPESHAYWSQGDKIMTMPLYGQNKDGDALNAAAENNSGGYREISIITAGDASHTLTTADADMAGVDSSGGVVSADDSPT